jgi:hypothetical protein
MRTVISSSKLRSWFGVASAIGIGVVAGAFIAGFSTGCKSSRPTAARSNERGGDAEADAGRPWPAQDAATAKAEGGPGAAAAQAVSEPGASDAASAQSDAPRLLKPIRRQRTRKVDREHVQQGQPLPRDYVE